MNGTPGCYHACPRCKGLGGHGRLQIEMRLCLHNPSAMLLSHQALT